MLLPFQTLDVYKYNTFMGDGVEQIYALICIVNCQVDTSAVECNCFNECSATQMHHESWVHGPFFRQWA